MKLIKHINKEHIILLSLTLYIILTNFSIVFAYNSSESERFDFDILSENVYVLDADTGITLYEKNANLKAYPASTTKIMTALLLLENVDDPNEQIEITQEAVDATEPGSSSAGLRPGEIITAKDAFYTIMLPSANEVANAIAIHISGSIDAFAELMNERARELGAFSTHFENPSGLHSPTHYTTAHDLALIMQEAIKHPEFSTVTTTYQYIIPPTNLEEERYVHNSNKMIRQGNEFYNPTVLGGKTGYTSDSGHTLVTYGQGTDNYDNTHNIIVSIMGGEKYTPYKDTNNLLEYFYSDYTEVALLAPNEALEEVPIRDSSDNIISYISAYTDGVEVLLPNSYTTDDIEVVYKTADISLPILTNDNVGTVSFMINDNILSEVPTYSNTDILKAPDGADVTVDTVKSFTTFLTKYGTWLLLILLIALVIVGVVTAAVVYIKNMNKRKAVLAETRRKRRRNYEEVRSRINLEEQFTPYIQTKPYSMPDRTKNHSTTNRQSSSQHRKTNNYSDSTTVNDRIKNKKNRGYYNRGER